MGLGILTLLLLSIVPQSPYVDDSVDEIELNHTYDDKGDLQLTQLIFWEWVEDEKIVVAWRLWKRGKVSKDLIWYDGDVLRRVRAKVYRETWTQYDPEINNLCLLPKNLRRGLTSGTIPAPRRPAK